MSRDLKLDSNWDLAIENGDLQYIENGAKVAQSWKIRMLWILGEWYANLALGMPWFDTMFKLVANANAKRQIIFDMTLGTPGVKSIKSFEETRENRTGFLAMRIETDYNTAENLEL